MLCVCANLCGKTASFEIGAFDASFRMHELAAWASSKMHDNWSNGQNLSQNFASPSKGVVDAWSFLPHLYGRNSSVGVNFALCWNATPTAVRSDGLPNWWDSSATAVNKCADFIQERIEFKMDGSVSQEIQSYYVNIYYEPNTFLVNNGLGENASAITDADNRVVSPGLMEGNNCPTWS